VSGIVVLGGEGMLGHKMFLALDDRFPGTKCTVRGPYDESFYGETRLAEPASVLEDVDAMDVDVLTRLLTDRRPDVVVNCIGIIKQRDEASSPIPSITINSLLPHRLAAAAAAWGGRIIHFSTDCVFSGRRGAYTEDDISDAEDLYGRSKYLGEVDRENALTLRTSIIGRELSHFQSLLEWFLAQDGQTVRGFTRHFWSGVTTNHLAALTGDLIAQHPRLSGVYQVSSGRISKYELLTVIRDAFQLEVEILPDDRESCDRTLSGEKFCEATGYRFPGWSELAGELAADPTPYQSWRSSQ
jgi:dTDP-4-dehydrorhamnose reductase